MALFVAVAVSLGILVASLGPQLHGLPAVLGSSSATEDQGRRGAEGVANGGYRFNYPSEWKTRSNGAVTKVSSPGRRIVVSVGPAPRGSLRRASDTFLAYLRHQYVQVHVSSAVRDSIRGRIALLTRGTLSNERRSNIRLSAIALRVSGRHYLVAGFSNLDVDYHALLIHVERIADSLRPLASV